MRRGYCIWAVVLGCFLMSSPQAKAITLGEIDFWVGSGANQAALVIDWNDGKSPEALAWGFRWDGTATVADMYKAIAGTTHLRAPDTGAFIADFSGADPRLYVRMSQHSFGEAIFGIGYDLDGDGGSFLPGVEGNETGFASDPDDHYIEGWFDNGYFFTINATDGGPFDFNTFSFPGMEITDGLIFGFSFDDDFSTFNGGIPGDEPIDVVAAAPGAAGSGVPEPGTIIMLGMSGIAMLVRRRTRGAE